MNPFPEIENLLPHRDRMLLIDTIIEVSTTQARTQTIAKPHWPLVTDNHVNPVILIELAAQTAGICLGWTAMQSDQGSDGAPKGVLVGVKRAAFFVDNIALDKKIETHTENKIEADNYKEIGATITQDGEKIAEIHLQVLQDEKTAFSDLSG